MLKEELILKRINQKGYVEIKIEKWILEHVYIVETFLNRKLTKEVVHHDNFDKTFNNISNLTLFPNQTAHAKFHRQIRQFGITNPRISELKRLKELILIERNKNVR